MKKEETLLKSWFKPFKKVDNFYIQLTITLIISGIIFAFSASVYESFRITNSYWSLGIKQLFALFVGLFVFVILFNGNYKALFKYAIPLGIFIFIIMLITIYTPIGKISGGSQRWINIAGFQFQPAEVAKFLTILIISKLLTKYRWNNFKQVSLYLCLALLITLLILKQPDLGSASILVLVTFELLFIFGWPVLLLLGFVPVTFTAIFLKLKSTAYQMDRIIYWLNPYLDPEGKGYNLIQANYAFALGGLFGAGIGSSIQKKGFLPVPHSDFIVAIIGEEIGLIGLSAILILYLAWILRGVFLINKIKNKFGKILGTAIILLIVTQALINICVATGLFPITGVTLPLFSCGGTSLIVTLGMLGVLFNILASEAEQIQEP